MNRNMRTYIKGLLAVACAAGFASCEDFKDANRAETVAPIEVSVNLTLDVTNVASTENFTVRFDNYDEDLHIAEEFDGIDAISVDGIIPGIYTVTDVIVFADDYIRRCLKALGLEGMTEAKYDDGVIKLNIVCNRNKNVIGRNGDTLRSINELTRSACFNRFGGHYRILLNCDGYKESKYDKFVAIARRYADEVCRTHITAIMDPMTSDERRIIHQALSDYPNIKTQSLGTGHKRHITIQYTGPEN